MMRSFAHSIGRCSWITVVWLGCASFVVPAAGEDTAASAAANVDSRDRGTAVALNFCRASFHRIRKYPTSAVMYEEREKILNNLDLNGIADAEVIKLYTAVLDEIGQVQMAEHEKTVIADKHRDAFRRRLGGSTVALGLQLASGSFLDAARTGASSWWDYRDMVLSREMETWRIEKTRITTVVSKSSTFLDTFWKLAQSKHIPDRWLVRGDDLNRLEDAMREPDLEVRLRILKRMEPFMECYPPYWYYLARTQQMQGQLFAAAETYDKLANLASGHFRRDEMLAAGLANRAAIQEYLGQPGSVMTALEALEYSTGVWEANLMCARILHRHGRLKEAEDAILRNLDVDLEKQESTVALVSLYGEPEFHDKLLAMLEDETVLAKLPALALVQSSAQLAPKPLPDRAVRKLAQSMTATIPMNFGMEHVVLKADSTWRAGSAKLALRIGNRRWDNPAIEQTDEGESVIEFREVLELGHPFRPTPALPVLAIDVDYAGGAPVELTMRPVMAPGSAPTAVTTSSGYRGGQSRRSTGQFQLAGVRWGTTQLALLAGTPGPLGTATSTVPEQAPAPQPKALSADESGRSLQVVPANSPQEAQTRPASARVARPRQIEAPDPRQARRSVDPLAARVEFEATAAP